MLAKVLCGANQEYYTVAVGLYQMLDVEYIDQWFCSFAAGAVIISIPVAILFLCTQKYYVEGVSGIGKSDNHGNTYPHDSWDAVFWNPWI